MSIGDPQWVKIVLDELAEIKEDLLTLYDDIQNDGDKRDSTARRETLGILNDFNEKLDPLERAIDDMLAFIERVTGIQRDAVLSEAMPAPTSVTRVVLPLNPKEPHALTEDFRWTKPAGFMLSGSTEYPDAWNKLYERFCALLSTKDPDRFKALPDVPEFSDSNPTTGFSRSRARFRAPIRLPHGLYCEGSLSARNITNNIRRLLAHFSIPESQMIIYLREDRNAEVTGD